MIQFGMPTLIENRTLQENIDLCSRLGLRFIELNMNFPEYQVDRLEKTGELLDALFGALPPGPLLFDGETVSDHPRRVAVADVIREKLIGLLHDELPHAVGVRVDDIAERPGEPVLVRGTVLVCRSGQKGVVLGEKGRTLRAATRASERELADFFGTPVRVELWIRVEPDWNRNFFLLRQLGYV